MFFRRASRPLTWSGIGDNSCVRLCWAQVVLESENRGADPLQWHLCNDHGVLHDE